MQVAKFSLSHTRCYSTILDLGILLLYFKASANSHIYIGLIYLIQKVSDWLESTQDLKSFSQSMQGLADWGVFRGRFNRDRFNIVSG